ncbi:uncharacterized protein VTP21DRAFT_1267 [Calcarisporiella thermophila]|uniref:uncharacterized protein n=1 Tax=Calcarisporiella thermophila TaxID=911321 RepID=UPI0037426B54
MRIRLNFEHPLTFESCWYHIASRPSPASFETSPFTSKHDDESISELAERIARDFELPGQVELHLNGYALFSRSPAVELLRENDLVCQLFEAPLANTSEGSLSKPKLTQTQRRNLRKRKKHLLQLLNSSQEENKDMDKVESDDENVRRLKHNETKEAKSYEENTINIPLHSGTKNKRKGYLKEMSGKRSQHIRFDSDQIEDVVHEDSTLDNVQANKSSPKSLPPARAFVTEVDVEEEGYHHYRQQRRASLPTSTNPSVRNRISSPETPRNSPARQGWRQKSDEDVQSKTQTIASALANEPSCNVEHIIANDRDISSGQHNYEAMAKLLGRPVVGQVIAYKILEMTADYTPIVATVQAYNPSSDTVTLRLDPSTVAASPWSNEAREYDEAGEPILRKFELGDAYLVDAVETSAQEVVEMDWSNLMDYVSKESNESNTFKALSVEPSFNLF